MSTHIAIACAVLAFWSTLARAQVTTATFYGIVNDPAAAVVPGATVALTNEGTQATLTQTTDAAGEFVFHFVPIGRYTLRIEAQGFKTAVNTGIALAAGQSIRRTFQLELGAVAERVEVTTQTPMVNTVSSEQRENITTMQAVELPLARRNLAGLVTLTTGSVRSGGDVYLNGGGRGGTSISVDGTDATGNPERPSLAMFGDFNFINGISIEAVNEVQIIKGVIPAEYTRAMGGNLNVISRSGTNGLHGSAFENFRAENLNARPQFLASKPGSTFNQFGGSLGGPIIRDRIFGFGVYEGYRDRSFATVQGNVPTQRLRDAMLRAVPEYKLFLDTLPLANQSHDPAGQTGRFVGAGSVQNNDNHFLIKPDARITNFLTASMTYTRFRPERLQPRVQSANFRRFQGQTDRVTAIATMFRSRWTSESRYGYNFNLVDRVDGIFLLKDPGRPEGKVGGRSVPCVNAVGFSGCGEIISLGAPNHSFDQKVAVILGRHSVKLGGVYFRRALGRQNIESPDFRYQNEADLLANIPNQITFTFGVDQYGAKAHEWGLFVQDDWRVTPTLVINLGLRNDVFGHYVAHGPGGGPPLSFNRAGFVDDRFTLGSMRPPDSPYDNDALNLAPRIGFSWNPGGTGKNVIRGGLSTIFTNLAGETFTQTVQNAIDEPFRTRFSRQEALDLRIKYPAYNEDVLRIVRGGVTGGSPRVLDPHMRAAYSMNTYLGYQRELARNLALETGFLMNRGVKWQTSRIANDPDPLTGVRPNPAFASMDFWDNADNTRYFAWQSSLRHRYSRNLTANLHYTWGKALAYGSGDTGWTGSETQNFFDLRSNRGPAAGDVTHNFVSDVVYDLPKLRDTNPLVRHVIGGWQVSSIVSARTGLPINVTQPSARSGSRPDYVGGQPTLPDYRQTLQYLNRAAFQVVPESRFGAAIRPGTLGRNALRGTGLLNVDFCLAKNFNITERVRLQVRTDMFNSINHTNFTGIDTNSESANFGRLTGTAGAREIQLGARFVF
ncbi:MAG: TonB-dependent receptor domain-containing protein [Bryobacteraceae bacterium]